MKGTLKERALWIIIVVNPTLLLWLFLFSAGTAEAISLTPAPVHPFSSFSEISDISDISNSAVFTLLKWIKGFLVVFLIIVCVVRFSEQEVLKHPVRKDIYRFIEENPGINYSSLMKGLSLKNGVLSYHLKILEKSDLITSLKKSGQRVFYARTCKNIPESLSSRILYTIRTKPGVYQSELAKMLGIRRQMVHYHVSLLLKADKIWIQNEGRKIHLYPRYKT